MAVATGYSQSSISRIWRAFALAPHRSETFKRARSMRALHREGPRRSSRLPRAARAGARPLGRREDARSRRVDRTAPACCVPGQVERHTRGLRAPDDEPGVAALDVAPVVQELGECQTDATGRTVPAAVARRIETAFLDRPTSARSTSCLCWLDDGLAAARADVRTRGRALAGEPGLATGTGPLHANGASWLTELGASRVGYLRAARRKAASAAAPMTQRRLDLGAAIGRLPLDNPADLTRIRRGTLAGHLWPRTRAPYAATILLLAVKPALRLHLGDARPSVERKDDARPGARRRRTG